MAVNDGASGIRPDEVKPIANKERGNCPCDAFLHCCSRRPYGQKVWSEAKTRSQACSRIIYDADSLGNTSAYANTQVSFGKNQFYKNIDSLTKVGQKAMAFPKVTEDWVRGRITGMRGSINNAAAFKPIQKSVVLRANLVMNGGLVSSKYLKEDGTVEFEEQTLRPFRSNPLGDEWSIDHIQAKSKGGCNRFCNAALLSWGNNSWSKNDDGAGCPCVDALNNQKNEQPKEHQTKFDCASKSKRYTLYNCIDFCLSKHKDNQNMPSKPLGTINTYRDQLCGMDSPLEPFNAGAKMTAVSKEAASICSSGK